MPSFPNWLDIAVAFFVIIGAARGYRRGLVREGMALVGLLGGMAVAAHWQKAGAAVLAPFVGPGAVADTLSYLGIVLLCLGAATLLTLVIQRLFRILLVGWVDRAAGLLFGGAQGAILAALILLLIVKSKFLGLDSAVADSQLASVVLDFLPAVIALLPAELSSFARDLTSAR